MGVRVGRMVAGQPVIRLQPAHAGQRGVEEVGRGLQVVGQRSGVVGQRRPARRHRAVEQAGEQRLVLGQHGQQAGGIGGDRIARLLRTGDDGRFGTRQPLGGQRAEVDRAVAVGVQAGHGGGAGRLARQGSKRPGWPARCQAAGVQKPSRFMLPKAWPAGCGTKRVRQSSTAGRPLARARTSAGATSAAVRTVSPWQPKPRAMAA